MKMDILAEAAVRVTVLALGLLAVLRGLGIRSPRIAHGAWAAVVVVMLILPLVVAWGPEIVVPLIPSRASSEAAASAPGEVVVTGPAAAAIGERPAPAWRLTRTEAIVSVYAAGVVLFLLRLAVGFRSARRLRHGAVLAHGRLSHPGCVTPVTVGMLAPVVILPADWERWDRAELSAVLAHEEEHARRRDPLIAAAALVNRAIFWFHPLAWWLQREIARLAEQACDEAVIRRGHDRDLYAACLLRFARRTADAGGRLAPMAPAMPGAGLRARLGMLASPPAVRPSAWRLACAVAASAAVVVAASTATPGAAAAQGPSSLVPAAAPWPIATSDHFEISHDHLPIDQVNEAVRDVEAAYAQLSEAFKYELPRRVPIILVRRNRDVDNGVKQAVTGAGGGPHYVVLSVESLGQRTGIAVHELTHRFAFDIVPGTSRVAPVLIEGLADQQRGMWPGSDLRLVQDAAASGAVPPVSGLVPTDRHWAHAVFDFVAARDGAEGIRRLLFALRAHDTLDGAVPMAFGASVEQFNREFRTYVANTFRQR